jgi:hypothetical protein
MILLGALLAAPMAALAQEAGQQESPPVKTGSAAAKPGSPAKYSHDDWLWEGVYQLLAGKLDAAQEALDKASEIIYAPRTIALLALVEARMGACARARERLRWIDLKALPAPLATTVQDAFSAPGAVCAREADQGSPVDFGFRCAGSIRVETEPPGADVVGLQKGPRVGELLWGASPIEKTGLCPGDIHISARLRMYADASRIVRLAPGESKTVKLTLAKRDRNSFLDEYRSTAALGVSTRFFAGASENGTKWGLFDGIAVGPSLSTWWREYRMTATAEYQGIPKWNGGRRHAATLRGYAEYARPLLRVEPLPVMDTRAIQARLGIGGGVTGWNPRSVSVFAQGGIQIFWLTLGGFYERGFGLWMDKGVSWTAGISALLEFYL